MSRFMTEEQRAEFTEKRRAFCQAIHKQIGAALEALGRKVEYFAANNWILGTIESLSKVDEIPVTVDISETRGSSAWRSNANKLVLKARVSYSHVGNYPQTAEGDFNCGKIAEKISAEVLAAIEGKKRDLEIQGIRERATGRFMALAAAAGVKDAKDWQSRVELGLGMMLCKESGGYRLEIDIQGEQADSETLVLIENIRTLLVQVKAAKGA